MKIRRLKAFTLTELLTVIAIIAILVGILIPVVGRLKESTKISTCLSNLRQIGTLAATYSADHKGWALPPSYKNKLNDEGYVSKVSPIWLCPSDERDTKGTWTSSPTSYACNAEQVGWVPAYYDQAMKKVNQIEKPSKTVYFSDGDEYIMRTYNPVWNFRHDEGKSINALLFDGHVERLTLSAPSDFQKLLNP